MNTSSNGHTSSRPPDSLAQPRLAPLFAHELLRLVNVREGGRTIRLPAIRAIARRQIAQAIDGKSCDLSGLIKTAQMIEREREKEKPAKSDSEASAGGDDAPGSKTIGQFRPEKWRGSTAIGQQ